MNEMKREVFTPPWVLATALLVFGVAIIEKGLNMFGQSIPLTDVFPQQLLDWTLTLLVLEIALTLRQMFERQLSHPRD